MKHIKLFEDFSQGGYKAISVFPEGGSDLYVGVFPADEANDIYSQLSSNRNLLVQQANLQGHHDVVVSQLGGEGLHPTHSGSLPSGTPVVRVGENYPLGEAPLDSTIPFLVDKSLGGFVAVNSAGMTSMVPVEEILALGY